MDLTQNMATKDRNIINSRMALIYDRFLTSGDTLRAKKLTDLFVKATNHQFAICFTGHFSAGKSSMVNELIGENILTSSPIPTSANLVIMQHGEPGIKITNKDDTTISLKPPYNKELIKEYTKDSNDVIRMTIYHQDVPNSLIYMDTPGIDSTDDTHIQATENALHIADAIFYMVEYNHVQSSTNFKYLKELSDYNKPIYLIVNQIDKHTDKELTFKAYKEQVITSLKQWMIHVEKIYFTSLKETPVKNDLPMLKHDIHSFHFSEIEEQQSLNHALLSLIHEHMDWRNEQIQSEKNELEYKSLSYSQTDLISLTAELEQLKQQYSKQENAANKWLQDVKSKLKKTVNSAILMPYDTREFARQYVESRDPDFKVGFLFGRKKTTEERARRLKSFYNSLSKNISTLEWHIKDLLENELKNSHLNQSVIEKIYQIELKVSPEVLSKTYSEGARTTGQYILNYTEEIANQIRTLGTKMAWPIIEDIHDYKFSVYQNKLDKTASQIKKLKSVVSALHALQNIKQEHSNVELEIKGILTMRDDELSNEQESLSQLFKAKKQLENIEDQQPIHKEAKAVKLSNSKKMLKQHKDDDTLETRHSYDLKSKSTLYVNSFQHAAKTISSINGFQQITKQIESRADRLESNQFIIALFGAFSAGKSSFANALLGEDILPVSPHPTTATINKVLPVTDQLPHGTVKIRLKTEDDIINELDYSCQKLDVTLTTIHGIGELLYQIDEKMLDPSQQLHYSFLKAVNRGYPNIQNDLGQYLNRKLATSHDYIAKEEVACFVESVAIYYDCPLTQQGIVLVDTPGADSINARHTHVAFDYIKKSDSILYVTYYNHAFSRADREFLRQLGRVKDTFALDKMFFIINAIDLAESETDKQDVINYVEQHLISFGIRNPRTYGISSLLALYSQRSIQKLLSNAEIYRYNDLLNKKEIMDSDDQSIYELSGMARFTNDWYRFTSDELLQTTVTSGFNDINNVIHRLDQLIKTAQLKMDDKQSQLAYLNNILSQSKDIIASHNSSYSLISLSQQVDELFFYIKKRLMMRFYDEFKVFFNPSVLSGSRSNIQSQLEKCLDELVEFLSFDLDQELDATALRAESVIKKLITTIQDDLQRTIQELNENWILSIEINPEFDTPIFPNHFTITQIPKSQDIFQYYRNAKQFFEGDGQEKLQQALEKKIDLPIDDVLNKNKKIMIEHYSEKLTSTYETLVSKIAIQITELYEGEQELLTNSESHLNFEQAKDELENILQNLKK